MMLLRFWGTRGSLPVSLTAPQVRAKLVAALTAATPADLQSEHTIAAFVDGLGFAINGTFGGHSSCVQLESRVLPDDTHVLFDMGSGARPFSQALLARLGPARPQTYHVFMSHLHWDHIMGFPFFTPAYIPGNRIVIHTCHPNAEHAFRRQQGEPSFPVDFAQMGADIRFEVHAAGTPFEVAGLVAEAKLQRHAGDSYGWRVGDGERSMVYTTDSEHDIGDEDQLHGFIEFFRDADAVVFDAMYSLADAISVKADWGHSSNIVGVELCQAARAKRFVMFHHEPAFDDATIAGVLDETRRFERLMRNDHALEVISAWDGLELSL